MVPALGKLIINGQTVKARDGVAIHGVEKIDIEAIDDSEILIADVPKL